MNKRNFVELQGKKVLVTGATGGIGSAIARNFGKQGAIVGIHFYKNEERAEMLSREIKEEGGQPIILQADLTIEKEILDLVGLFYQKTGGIDIVVNNAGGIADLVHFEKITPAEWDGIISLNLKAPFFIMRESFLRMKAQKKGRIINISSVAAKYGGSEWSVPYGVAKAGIENLTVFFSRVGAQYNILVNCVRPGVIDTEFQRRIRTDEQLKNRISLIPLKRMGTPDDVAMMVLFLASDAGSFITGQIISVSGGE
ncbi:MAG: SDR family oxidoreductase [Candidatus Omnitrophica bacterium]|jgi:3-oxoacyl-[acyl-carrier protein] reductase|nr:SDR family oxidoreductase [Candidatus Omnitrophota bacterium]